MEDDFGFWVLDFGFWILSAGQGDRATGFPLPDRGRGQAARE